MTGSHRTQPDHAAAGREQGEDAPRPCLVSACLAGMACRYDGGSRPHPEVRELLRRGLALPVCPEQLGGLPTPRPPASVRDGDGEDVLDGRARVVTNDGRQDVTEAFIRGAEQTLHLARLAGARRALFQARSPSCGDHGVTAALLRRAGLTVRNVEGERVAVGRDTGDGGEPGADGDPNSDQPS